MKRHNYACLARFMPVRLQNIYPRDLLSAKSYSPLRHWHLCYLAASATASSQHLHHNSKLMAKGDILKATGGALAAGAAYIGGRVCDASSPYAFIRTVGYRVKVNLQAYYQVWTAEQECRVYQRQSAEHTNVIEQSQSAISQQEKQTTELFVTRREQQQVCLEPHHQPPADGCICSLQQHLNLHFYLEAVRLRHGWSRRTSKICRCRRCQKQKQE